jgi:hypothetical protein
VLKTQNRIVDVFYSVQCFRRNKENTQADLKKRSNNDAQECLENNVESSNFFQMQAEGHSVSVKMHRESEEEYCRVYVVSVRRIKERKAMKSQPKKNSRAM